MTEENHPDIQGTSCPLPLSHQEQIVIGHGSGGKMTSRLIEETFLPAFDNGIIRKGDDAGVIDLHPSMRIAVSTDSHVVSPLFFPGGDIGKLAICGTVNDVAVMGAAPLYLTAGFILEEGLPMETLQRVVASMKAAAEEAGIQIIAGDTKVVQHGHGDGIYINTTGIGLIPEGIDISGSNAREGDLVILSGTIGDHGMAVLAARNELGFDVEIKSDTAPLNRLIQEMMNVSSNIHVLRDPTRGGVASTLNEIAVQSNCCIVLDETTIPVKPQVNAICEILGFDPLFVANEGKVLAIVTREDGERLLETMHKNPYGKDAVIIGEIRKSPERRVLMRTAIGGTRIVDTLTGEMLPRIC